MKEAYYRCPAGPMEIERMRTARKRKLAIIWTVYAMIVGGLVYWALWIGNFRWNSEATIASFVILTVPLSLVIFRLLLQMDRLIRMGVERWWDILRYGVPVGDITDVHFEREAGITNFDGSYVSSEGDKSRHHYRYR